MKQTEFEPIFGSMALYCFEEGDQRCCRLSESFHFSCTSPALRERYKDVYRFSEDDLSAEIRREMPDIYAPTSHCLFTIPMEIYRHKDVFLVVQLTKVTSDTERLPT